MNHRTLATLGLIVIGVAAMAGLSVTLFVDKSPDPGFTDTFKLVAVACVTAIAGLVQGSGGEKEKE